MLRIERKILDISGSWFDSLPLLSPLSVFRGLQTPACPVLEKLQHLVWHCSLSAVGSAWL